MLGVWALSLAVAASLVGAVAAVAAAGCSKDGGAAPGPRRQQLEATRFATPRNLSGRERLKFYNLNAGQMCNKGKDTRKSCDHRLCKLFFIIFVRDVLQSWLATLFSR